MSNTDNYDEGSTPNSNTETTVSNVGQQAEGSMPNTDSENIAEKSDQILVPSGRTRTVKNALVHGLYASDVVLPWESEEEFHRLFTDLKIEWRPQGRQEMETVLSLARLNWLKHRLMRSTQIAFRRDPFLAELEKVGAKTWADVAALMEQKARAEDDLADELRTASKELRNALKNASDMMTATDRDTHEIYRKVEAVEQMFEKFHMPLYQKAFDKVYSRNPRAIDKNEPNAFIQNPETLLEQAYHPDYLEKLVRLEASIDTRIDKLLQRLTSLKEYKRLARESTKTISSPTIAPRVTDGEV